MSAIVSPIESLIDYTSNLCLDELALLKSIVESNMPNERKMLKATHDIIKVERPSLCPHCKKAYFVKNGTTKQGRQKYTCKSCSKHFSDTTNSCSLVLK